MKPETKRKVRNVINRTIDIVLVGIFVYGLCATARVLMEIF